MTRPAIVVVGDLMVDVVAAAAGPLAHASDTEARVRWTGGGAAANVAAWLAAAGAPVALVARTGDDVAGRSAVAELVDAGIDVRVAFDAERPTGTCVVVIGADGERTMLPDRGANLALAVDDLPGDVFAAGGHLHLSGYVLLHAGPRAAGLAALDRARAAGMTISVDPASAAPLRAAGVDRVLGWIGRVDLLLPNADEAAALTGEADPERAARALATLAGAREVVVTLGVGGAVWTDGSTILRAPAPAADVVDTTGAGDAFAGGWLAARRAGAGVPAALEAACASGARAVAGVGARP
ncbi:MAG TPA: PfkB family carbohydrate kinase [Baekduia sp.]|uniref:carbohydrate kinase family protein n=1 Tax=Baekduia sp. TaxID=2600305 RepID=UPI002C417DDF|nr:PfkB family carbohydrate kinase [Baekduia sp.]HMJ37616.1 PfkB family carbohydrate kinase [Baekduia sp.]